MRSVTVVYHCEDGDWWAESPDRGLETFVAGGAGLAETRRLAAEGLEFHLGEPVNLTEIFEDGELIDERGATVVSDLPSFAIPRPATTTRPTAVSLVHSLPAIEVRGDEPVRGAA